VWLPYRTDEKETTKAQYCTRKIAGVVVNLWSVHLKYFVLNEEESASNPLLPHTPKQLPVLFPTQKSQHLPQFSRWLSVSATPFGSPGLLLFHLTTAPTINPAGCLPVSATP